MIESGTILSRLDGSSLSPWVRAVRDFRTHRGPVRAASLSYTSLLALVPLLALVLSISKGVLRNQDPQLLLSAIDRVLDYAVPQLRYLSADEAASARQDALARIQEGINRIDAGALGAFGAITLVSVGISLLSAVEHALNDVWAVSRGRTLARSIVYYWAGVTLGPIFLFLALGITGSNAVAAVLGHLPGGLPARLFWRVLPLVILSAGFTLLYWTMPNTYVPPRAAVLGGITAGALLQLNNAGSALYFSQVVQYSKVYGGIGAIPVMMIGLYVSWMIVLYGAEVAHAAASPEVKTDPFPEGDAGRSQVVLEVARAATVDFLAGRGGTTREELAERLRFPDSWVAKALELLCEGGFLVATGHEEAPEEPPRYLPARPPSTIAVIDILTAVRRPASDSRGACEPALAVDALLARQGVAERSALGDVTLEALAAEEPRS
ncbi:MAG: YihY/virulence factor BrkB family protein [Candidatus Binatia bacterium]